MGMYRFCSVFPGVKLITLNKKCLERHQVCVNYGILPYWSRKTRAALPVPGGGGGDFPGGTPSSSLPPSADTAGPV